MRLVEANKAIASPTPGHTQIHLHPDRLHITYTEKGKGRCRVEGREYNIHPGVMHFVYPNEIHQYHTAPEDPYRTYFLHFDCIGKAPKGPRLILVNKKDRKKINQLFNKLFYFYHYYKGVARTERILALLFELFAEISDYTDSLSQQGKKNVFDEEFFMDVLNQLYTPPFHNPGIDVMARQKNMSRRTFTRVFRRNTGMSVVEYLTRAKLTHARYLLENSNLSIKQIASECGYANSQNLRRALKKFSA